MKSRHNLFLNFLISTMIVVQFVSFPIHAENANQNYSNSYVVDNFDSTMDEFDIETNHSNANQSDNMEVDQNAINYVMINKPYVSSSEIQTILISIDDQYQNIISASLIYIDVNNNEYEMKNDLVDGHVLKFEKEFHDEETGEYVLNRLEFVSNNQKYIFYFDSVNIEAKFGVNMEYNGLGLAEGIVVDEQGNILSESVLNEENISSSVIQLDGFNSSEITSEIDEKIQNRQYFSADFINYTPENPLVIALDPGHGGIDGGMTAVNGVSEKVYTLQIANYLKKELEKYNNCKVVMTRTSDVYVDLVDRAKIASNSGASILISLHLNSANRNAHGAEVYYPNSNYNSAVSDTGKKLAQQVLNELISLGISNRGIHVKYIYDEVTGEPTNDPKYDYPDGSIGDYYGIIRHCKTRGIAAVIVEHCFADNIDDFNKFLSSDDKIKNLAIADANGIAKAFNLSMVDRDKLDQLAQTNKNTIEDGVYEIKTAINGKYVLDMEKASMTDGGNLQLYESNGTSAQRWKISHDEKGYVTIENINSGKVLDVDRGKANDYQNVQQYMRNNTYAQKWIITKDDAGYMIMSGLDSAYVMDVRGANAQNGSNVQIYSSNASSAQRWQFVKSRTERDKLDQLAQTNKNTIEDGVYEIKTAINGKYVLDMEKASMTDGGNLQLYESNGTSAQRWKISHDEKGYVTIENINSGKVLDVDRGKANDYQNVQQYMRNNTYAQKWIITKDDAGYMIMSGLDSAYVMDVRGANAQNGSNVQIYSSNASSAQRWQFVKSRTERDKLDQLAQTNKNTIEDGVYEIKTAINGKYVLDMEKASMTDGGNLQLYESNGTSAQRWKISHDEKGYVTIENINSGKVLDVDRGKANDYQNVQQYMRNNTYAQKWIITKDDAGYMIMSGLDSAYVMDVRGANAQNGSNVQIYSSNASSAQRWQFVKSRTERDKLDQLAQNARTLMEDGNYIIKTVNLHYVLGTDNNSLNNVIISNLDNSPYQIWTLSHDSKGYVSFKNHFTDTYLSVENNSVFNSNNVVLQKWNNSYNQKWIVQINKKGKIMITSALDSNFVLDVQGGSLQNGTNVQIYESNLSNAQQWIFSPIQNIPEQQLHPIMGSTSTTINKMISLFKKYNNHYDKGYKSGSKYDGILAKGGASTIEEFCKMYYEEAQAEGVKAEIAFAQAMIETGWLTFGGDVKPDQYNFAGMGATGNGVSGNAYQNVRIGIRAQIQHLKCYASKEPLNQSLVDQRWSDSLRGKAEYVEYLSIPNNPYGTGWASDKNYADKILNIVREM